LESGKGVKYLPILNKNRSLNAQVSSADPGVSAPSLKQLSDNKPSAKPEGFKLAKIGLKMV
jgi:hypothetical protein